MMMRAAPGIWTNDHQPLMFSYQWWRRETIGETLYTRPWWLLGLVRLGRTIYRVVDVPIEGATASTYTPVEADAGKHIGYNVTAWHRDRSQQAKAVVYPVVPPKRWALVLARLGIRTRWAQSRPGKVPL